MTSQNNEESNNLQRATKQSTLPLSASMDRLHLETTDADFVREFLAVMLVAEDEEPPLAAATTDESF